MGAGTGDAASVAQGGNPRYRPDIDGLRAMAVLAVVAFHAFPSWVKGGFIGVDVFFVISGYLISTIIFENLDKGTFSLSEFYSRRIRRIFPALLLVLISCFFFGWFHLLADEYKQLGKHIAGGSGFLSNFILWSEAGYFDNSAETKPLLHLWSLGIEEQFYILWPLFLWFAWRWKLNIPIITIAVVTAAFVLNIEGVKQDKVATFYSPQTRFWELLSGSLLAWVALYRKGASVSAEGKFDAWPFRIAFSGRQEGDGKSLANAISFAGLFLLLFGFWKIDGGLSFPGKWALIPVLGATLVIAAGSKAWINRTILSNRIAVWFGLISFPLYLWHWPLLSFARIVEGGIPSRDIRIAVVALSIVLAWLTYKLVERPLRFGKAGKIKAATLVVLMAAVGCIGFNTYEKNGIPDRDFVKKVQDFTYARGADGYIDCANKLLDFCFKSKSTKPNSVIIGDSHADDKFFGLATLDKNRSWMLLANSSCPPLVDVSVEANVKGCDEKYKEILQYVLRAKDINNVVLSFYFNLYLKSDGYAAGVANKLSPGGTKLSSSIFKGSRSDLIYGGLNSTIKMLTDSGKSVTLFIDVPELPFYPRDCLGFRGKFRGCEVSKADVIERQAEFRSIVVKLKISNPGLNIFDPIDLLCGSKTCSHEHDGRIFYRDSHHLTLRGSYLVAERFINTR